MTQNRSMFDALKKLEIENARLKRIEEAAKTLGLDKAGGDLI